MGQTGSFGTANLKQRLPFIRPAFPGPKRNHFELAWHDLIALLSYHSCGYEQRLGFRFDRAAERVRKQDPRNSTYQKNH